MRRENAGFETQGCWIPPTKRRQAPIRFCESNEVDQLLDSIGNELDMYVAWKMEGVGCKSLDLDEEGRARSVATMPG